MSSSNSIAISPEQAWRIYELLEEMNSFLHQPENYQDPGDVAKWLQSGVYRELNEVFYRIAATWFEVDPDTGHVIGPPGVPRKFPTS